MAVEDKILDQISARRDNLGWSNYKLAKEAGIPYSSINNMFKRNTLPTIPTLEKICHGLHISVSDFFLGIENDESEDQDLTPLYILDDEEAGFVDNLRLMKKKDRDLLQAYMKGLLKQVDTEDE